MVEGKDYGEMKKVLDADPYERESFVIVGYILKESKAIGLKGGNYVISFQSNDEAVVAALEAKLKKIPSAKEASKEEFDLAAKTIDAEQEAAGAGFGSLFG